MATIRIDGDTLRVELSGLDPLWAIHGSFAIPLQNVAGASTAKPPSFWSSLKLIGTNAPLLKMAGTFLYHGETVFFDYRGNEEGVLVIDLTGGTYRHLFVHVDDPEADAARVSAALAGAPAA
jgi:hypothetical protein